MSSKYLEYDYCHEANREKQIYPKRKNVEHAKATIGYRFNPDNRRWEKVRTDLAESRVTIYSADSLGDILCGRIMVETYYKEALYKRTKYSRRGAVLLHDVYDCDRRNYLDRDLLRYHKAYFENGVPKEEVTFDSSGRVLTAKCYDESGKRVYEKEAKYTWSVSRYDGIDEQKFNLDGLKGKMELRAHLNASDGKSIQTTAQYVIDHSDVEHLLQKRERITYFCKTPNGAIREIEIIKTYKEGKVGKEVLVSAQENDTPKTDKYTTRRDLIQTNKYYEEDENGNAYLTKRVVTTYADANKHGLPGSSRASTLNLVYEVDRDGVEKFVEKTGRVYTHGDWKDSEGYTDYVFDADGKPIETYHYERERYIPPVKERPPRRAEDYWTHTSDDKEDRSWGPRHCNHCSGCCSIEELCR